jgi:hypothetical protein
VTAKTIPLDFMETKNLKIKIEQELSRRLRQLENLIGHMVTGREIADGSHAKVCLEERIKTLKWVLGVIDE